MSRIRNALHRVLLCFDASSVDTAALQEFSFCYCEGGFRETAIGDGQMVFAKPQHGGALPARAPIRYPGT